MTLAVNIHDAKTQFSRLVARAEAGETIPIARGGREVALLVPLPAPERPNRVAGRWAGRVRYADGWEVMSEDELGDWYDGEIFPR